MNRLLHTLIVVPVFGLAALPSPAPAAVDRTEWKFRQDVKVDVAGLHRLELPPETLDAAAPDLRDVRLLDATGREIPWLAIFPGRRPATSRSAESVQTTLQRGQTVVTVKTGVKEPLQAVYLLTTNMGFIKPATVEISPDGAQWELIRRGHPLFREPAADGMRINLGNQPAAYVRLTLDDTRSRPIVIGGASVITTEEPPPPEVELPVRSVRRDEFAGETVFTVDLGARQLPLASLSFVTQEPLFKRGITIAARELRDGQLTETTLAQGSIFRIAGTEQLRVPLGLTAPQRELVVHVANGDSPPLAVDLLQLRRHDVALVFNAVEAGVLQLHCGNAQAAAPRYDLAALTAGLRQAPAATAVAATLALNPDYRPPAVLADVPLTGAPLDPAAWSSRKAVTLPSGEIHEIELDLDVLARARADFGDLRLLSDGAQIPYLVERTRLTRSATLSPVAIAVAKRPTVSRWELRLPRARLPLQRLVLTSTSPLFQRQLRVYERVADGRGNTYDSTLATAAWNRRPEDPATLRLVLTAPVATDTLFIETDNGDNPPLALGEVRVEHPVVRLLFKAPAGTPVALYYGNPAALAPRYDLELVAGRLFGAERSPAALGAEESKDSGWASRAMQGMRGGPIFWSALAVVVVALLFAVAKLLPKPPAA